MTTMSENIRYVRQLFRDTILASRDAMDEVRVRTKLPFERTESKRFLDVLNYDTNPDSILVIPYTYDTWRAPGTDAAGAKLLVVQRFYSTVHVFEPMLVIAKTDEPAATMVQAGWYFERYIRDGSVDAEVDAATGLTALTFKRPETHPKWHAFAVSLDRLTSREALIRVVVDPTVALIENRTTDLPGLLDAKDPARVAFAARAAASAVEGESP